MSNKQTTYGLPNKREKVIEQLNLAYSEQNLEEEEYERRLQEAINAKSIEELKLVVFDFPNNVKQRLFPDETPVIRETHKPSSYPAAQQDKIQTVLGEDSREVPVLSDESPRFSAILSEQKLDFRLSQVIDNTIYLRSEAILSSVKIDLRNENLEGKVINIHITGSLSDVKILLPRGGEINRNIQSNGGSFKIQDKNRSWIKRITGSSKSDNNEESNFVVNITGNFWFGNVKVVY